jgi:hypothetical protein
MKIVIAIVFYIFFANATASALARNAFNLEMDMIKSRTILTRRSIFRAGAGLAVAATATPLLTPRLGPG